MMLRTRARCSSARLTVLGYNLLTWAAAGSLLSACTESRPAPHAAQAMPAQEPVADVRAEAYTKSPLQMSLSFQLNAPPEKVWALVSDHEALPSYFAAVKKVEVDNHGAKQPGGVGAVRSCNLMGNQLVEKIRIFEPETALGYSIEQGLLPGMSDHLGLVRLRPEAGGTRLTWEQYFTHAQPAPVVQHIQKLIKGAGDGLVAKFGGRSLAGPTGAS